MVQSGETCVPNVGRPLVLRSSSTVGCRRGLKLSRAVLSGWKHLVKMRKTKWYILGEVTEVSLRPLVSGVPIVSTAGRQC